MIARKAGALLVLSFIALGSGCAGMRGTQGAKPAAAGATARADGDVSFLAADLNRDGRVTPREFERWAAARGDSRGRNAFQAADTNLDGVLTLDEWQEMVGGASAAAGSSSAPGAGVRP